MIDYGATFKRLREDKGLKIVDLEQPNISRSLIGKFERGQTRMSAMMSFYFLVVIVVIIIFIQNYMKWACKPVNQKKCNNLRR